MRRERALLADIIERALPPDARRRVFSVDLVARRWVDVVGEELARRSEPEALNDDGVLTIRVTDAAWGKTILRLQGRIVPALNRAIGKKLVRRINFTRRDRLVRQGESPPVVPEPKPVPVPPENVARAAEAIPDPELRELVTKTAARYLQAHRDRRRK